MFTRSKKSKALSLLQEVVELKEEAGKMHRLRSGEPAFPSLSQIYQKQDRRAALALKRQKRLLSCRRSLSWGEKHKIIQLRFGQVGSLEPTAFSYG